MLHARKLKGERERGKRGTAIGRRLTLRRSGRYPDLESFEVTPRARLGPVRLRRVDLATPELTECVEAFGFLVAIWMTPLSSWMVMVWERHRVSGLPSLEGFAGGNTLELARPEYLCEWMLSKLPLGSHERQPGTNMEMERWHTASLEKRGPAGSRFTTLELYFWGIVRQAPSWARQETYTDEQPLEISGHCWSSASLTMVAGCR